MKSDFVKVLSVLIATTVLKTSFCQKGNLNSFKKKDISNFSKLDVKGDSNHIIVTQNNNLNIRFDLDKESDVIKLVELLENTARIKGLILPLEKKIDYLTSVVKKEIANRVVFSSEELLLILEKRDEENQKLRNKIKNLESNIQEEDFRYSLMSADSALGRTDHDGFQNILDAYIEKIQKKRDEIDLNLAYASYLKSIDYYNEYKYDLARKHIQNAINYFPDSPRFLFLKSKILRGTNEFDSSSFFLNKIALYELTLREQIDVMKLSADILSCKGKYRESLIVLDSLRKVVSDSFPSDNYLRAEAQYLFSMSQAQVDNKQAAIEGFKVALGFLSQAGLRGCTMAGQIYNSLGIIYLDSISSDSTLFFMQSAQKIFSNIYGVNHPLLSMLKFNVGIFWRRKLDFGKALGFYKESLRIDKIFFGDSSLEAAFKYEAISVCMLYLDKIDSAKLLSSQSFHIKRKCLGENHPKLAQSYLLFGKIYEQQNNLDSTLIMFKSALDIQIATLEPGDVEISKSYSLIGDVLARMGQFYKAKEAYESALKILNNRFGMNNTIVKDLLEAIAICELLSLE